MTSPSPPSLPPPLPPPHPPEGPLPPPDPPQGPLPLGEAARSASRAGTGAAPQAVGARAAWCRRRLRQALWLLPLLVLAAWMCSHWRLVYEGAARLSSADPWWLLAGGGFTCLCWVASSCIRQGAVLERLPPGLLLASQFAAGAAGHVLPAGLGAHAVTLRFLQRRGVPFARATASLALYSLVKPVAGAALGVALLAVCPDTLHLRPPVPDARTVALSAVALAALGTVVVLLTTVRPLRRLAAGFLRTALTDARQLCTRPSRMAALWGGALAFPLLQASVLACVGASLGLPLTWPHVVFAYLVANTVGAAVPTPGGLGSADAVLVFTLSAFGAPVGLAAAAVIGYRMLTVWLPLLPGALVLTALVRVGAV